MSKDYELYRELESIQESALYKDFADMVGNISNMGVATAVLGGFLRAWCKSHNEDFMYALALILAAENEVRRIVE